MSTWHSCLQPNIKKNILNSMFIPITGISGLYIHSTNIYGAATMCQA